MKGRLKFSKKYLGKKVKPEDGNEFVIFRHITLHPLDQAKGCCTFAVSFKFARLSHPVNKVVSKLPMLMITGFPGFMTKMYAVNKASGYWMGLYQWESAEALEEYKKSLVFRMMNKRAVKGSIQCLKINNSKLTDYLETYLVRKP